MSRTVKSAILPQARRRCPPAAQGIDRRRLAAAGDVGISAAVAPVAAAAALDLVRAGAAADAVVAAAAVDHVVAALAVDHVGAARSGDGVGVLRPGDGHRAHPGRCCRPGRRAPGPAPRARPSPTQRRRGDPAPPAALHRRALCLAFPGDLTLGPGVMNTSECPLVSPGTRLVAKEAKATISPEASTTGPGWGRRPALAARPRPAQPADGAGRRRRQEDVAVRLESSGTRLVASEENTTSPPSADTTGAKLKPSPSAPSGPTDSRVVVAWSRRWRNTSSSVVRVVPDDVVGERGEGHHAAVGTDRRAVAAVVRLPAAGGQADPVDVAAAHVGHEHVEGAVGVVGHELGGERLEGHRRAVGADAPDRSSGSRSAPRDRRR